MLVLSNTMGIPRRQLFHALALAGGFRTARGAETPKIPLDVLRNVCSIHGTAISDARLEIVRPALEKRLSELEALRSFEPGETVGPTQGILPG